MINQTDEEGEIPNEHSSKDDNSKGIQNKNKEEKTSYKSQLKNHEVPNYLPYPYHKGKKVATWFHQWKSREERVNTLIELFKKLNSFDFKKNFPKDSFYGTIAYWDWIPNYDLINQANDPKYYWKIKQIQLNSPKSICLC